MEATDTLTRLYNYPVVFYCFNSEDKMEVVRLRMKGYLMHTETDYEKY